ncbi:MAG TPA: biotin/lipoyl-containing protein [Silvibacterium sp.]|nr:biotin/lipoyl-containing protein [Silvibacterium sp.]
MKLEIEIQDRLRTVELEAGEGDGRYRVKIDGELVEVEARLLRPGVLSLVVGDRSYRVVREDDLPATNGNDAAVLFAGRRYPYRVEDSRSLKARRAHGGGDEGPRIIKASMPGRVVRVLAARGEAVEAHQGVVVIEAMKMQNELKSPKAGTVVEMRVSPGDTVAAGDVLVVVE